MKFRAKNFQLDLSERTHIMGIVNVTPDSFSDGGGYLEPTKAVERVFEHIEAGADVIDLGAESSRPGASTISPREQLNRLIPVLEKIAGKIFIPISIDTTSSEVARVCLEGDASIINDISGFKQDPSLAQVVKIFEAGCVLMHMRGTPSNMQTFTQYSDLIKDISAELQESVAIAKSHGIFDQQIMLDPGIGFSKDARQNFEIIRQLSRFQDLGYPVLVGPSRKSFLKEAISNARQLEDRVWATAAAVTASILNGASFIRAHDVRQMRIVAQVTDSVLQEREAPAFF